MVFVDDEARLVLHSGRYCPLVCSKGGIGRRDLLRRLACHWSFQDTLTVWIVKVTYFAERRNVFSLLA